MHERPRTRQGAGRRIEDDAGVRAVIRGARRVAVLGAKAESHAAAPAFYVPAFLQQRGIAVVPVPVRHPGAITILGAPVYRRVADVPGDIDIVLVFRRAEHIPAHVPDLIAKRPATVWFQTGIRNEAAAAALVAAGIDVVQDRCALVELRAAP
jgi:predicted CoA-binding protein